MDFGEPSPLACLPWTWTFFGGEYVWKKQKQKDRFVFQDETFWKSPTLWSSTQLPIIITCSMLIHVNTVLKVTRTLMDPNLNLRYHLCRKSWGIDGGRSSEMPWKKWQPQGCGCGPSQETYDIDMKWHENNACMWLMLWLMHMIYYVYIR